MSVRETLAAGCAETGVDVSAAMLDAFETYADLLKKWSSAMNLTAIKKPEDVAIHHFLDSLTALRFVEPDSSVLDIGAGAGFPGIPLKICRPSINLVLADSREKRVFFMREVIRKLGLNGARAISVRIGSADKADTGSGFDMAVSRAAGRAPDIARAALPLVKKGGIVLIMKGKNGAREWAEESRQLPAGRAVAEITEEITLPVSGDGRFLLGIRKT